MVKTADIFKDRIIWILLIIVFFVGLFIGNTLLNDKSLDNSIPPTIGNKDEAPKKEVVKPDPIILEGVGQKATDKVKLKQGLIVFEMKHTGESNFSVWLLDNSGDKVELLVNEVGNFDGSKAVQIPENEDYLFDVSADGPWSIVAKQ
jgi:hypothetical protein